MTTIMADKDMVTALKHMKGLAQICDSKGQILGIFTPKLQETNNHPKLPPEFDHEEIERRKRSKEETIPHKEVMRHMRLLDAEIERRIKAGERKLTNEEAVAFVQRLRTKGKKKQNR